MIMPMMVMVVRSVCGLGTAGISKIPPVLADQILRCWIRPSCTADADTRVAADCTGRSTFSGI